MQFMTTNNISALQPHFLSRFWGWSSFLSTFSIYFQPRRKFDFVCFKIVLCLLPRKPSVKIFFLREINRTTFRNASSVSLRTSSTLSFLSSCAGLNFWKSFCWVFVRFYFPARHRWFFLHVLLWLTKCFSWSSWLHNRFHILQLIVIRVSIRRCFFSSGIATVVTGPFRYRIAQQLLKSSGSKGMQRWAFGSYGG